LDYCQSNSTLGENCVGFQQLLSTFSCYLARRDVVDVSQLLATPVKFGTATECTYVCCCPQSDPDPLFLVTRLRFKVIIRVVKKVMTSRLHVVQLNDETR